MRTTRGLIVVALTCLVWVAGLPALGASSLEDHGWWWRVAGLSGLPSPPWVPEDGLAVARDLEGPSAIAALRYEVGDDVSMATLTLEVASEQGGETAGIRACPARARWRGADAGDWEHRPGADCEAGEAPGERDEEGEAWTFDVGHLVDDGTLNIILLPGEAETPEEGAPAPPESGADAAQEGDEGPPFQVAFEPPTDDSLEASEGFGFDDTDGGDFDSDGSASDEPASDDPEQSGSPDVGADSGAPMPSGSGGQQPPSGDGPTDAPAPEVADAEEPTGESDEVRLMPPEAADEQARAEDEAAAAAPVGFGQDRGRQVAAGIALLTAVAAAMLWLSPGGAAGLHGLRPSLIVRPEVASRLGAAAAGGSGASGGLGRFAKPREGAPPPL